MKLQGWSYREKALEIFRELAGDRAGESMAGIPSVQNVIKEALADEFPPEVAHDIAFHLTDWNRDAAFIVALTLFTERFTQDEIRSGVEQFLIHAPNHIAAAAKLGGWPMEDIFEVGALDGRVDA